MKRSADSLFGRDQNLYVAKRINSVRIWQSFGAQLHNGLCAALQVGAFDKKKIAVLAVKFRHFPVIDLMCVPCNQALVVLPIDLRKRNGGKQSGGKDVLEYVSRPYGRKLVLISYQNQLNAIRERFQQMIHQ